MSRILYSGNWEEMSVGLSTDKWSLQVYETVDHRISLAFETSNPDRKLPLIILPEDIFREMILTCMGQTVGLCSGNRVPFVARTDQAKAVIRDNLEFLKRYCNNPSETEKGNVLRVAAALALCYMADEGILQYGQP